MTETIQETIDELRQTLTDYIEATYHIGHPTMVAQRQRLLEERGGIFQVPYLESTPRYVAKTHYRDMTIPAPAKEALSALADPSLGKPLVFDPPYTHQEAALEGILTRHKNLMIMTGTGSGKTESFLLPILGKLAIEARERSDSFRTHNAVRALVLYPMNALVNDQLGRLRLLFGNPRVISLFESWAGRPARFARYTSRTPYAGVRRPNKDRARLQSIGDFFVQIEQAAARHHDGTPKIAHEDRAASALLERLLKRGKWPSKVSLSDWFGEPHQHWLNREKEFQRAVLGPHDAEMLTRHEVQKNPPDLLITNYSMLEYMMLRPIERPIFDRTCEWLAANPDERILVVLDEAHLYRGTQGAEVGLLLRRLRERLGIDSDRFQVICATASFSEEGKKIAEQFGAELTGVPGPSFERIEGTLRLREPAASGMADDVKALCAVDVDGFLASDAQRQLDAVAPFLSYRGKAPALPVGVSLHAALEEYAPFNLLVNETMRSAIPLHELPARIFPDADAKSAEAAITSLMMLGSRARLAPDDPSLLPCRIHSFFRGLPGLWVCMDPDCRALAPTERGGPAGKLFAQPRERCECGAPVLEYYTCRYCGTSYARAYTNDVTYPRFIWREPGETLQTEAGFFEAHQPIDFLLEEPTDPARGMPATYDLRSGLINPAIPGDRQRTIYLRPQTLAADDDEGGSRGAGPGEFVPCGCCGQQFMFGQSSVQDHQTKGDQPFQALLSAQIRVQPPGPQEATEFAPLRGRKVLVFSDSRQVASRLAPRLQSYSLNDAVRALLPAGFQLLAADPFFSSSLTLDHAFLAVVVAAHRLGVRVRPELELGESMPRIDTVSIGQVPSGSELISLLSAPCPVNLMKSIIDVLSHTNLGLEPLAVATIAESAPYRDRVTALPALPGLAEDNESKLAVTRAWLRCWQHQAGIWFGKMPPNWWPTQVRPHKGGFQAMDRVLTSKEAKKVFAKDWHERLLVCFTEKAPEGGARLLASKLRLDIGGVWRYCPTCRSVHRPVGALTTCIDCGAVGVRPLDPDQDLVFIARKGFYRAPVTAALTSDTPAIMSLIASEHTAQLNAAQPDDAFSKAENHEIRFQDIDLAWRDTDPREPAIDVLSSTTTMEVGIDIGELSGVALRNMPPGRANYQQRSGRAGRRGNAVATVIAFGSSDSHDDHYFIAPDEMIRGPVVDPRLTLDNLHIAQRHVRAFLLQRYHEDRIPGVDPGADPNLFSVLGSVRDFRDGTGVINRDHFAAWLVSNKVGLTEALDRWLPKQLSPTDRAELINHMADDVLAAVDDAVGYVGTQTEGQSSTPPTTFVEGGEEAGDDDDLVDPSSDKLLDRLLYWGVLPRYAFPTDVAPFYVFNRALSTPFRPKMEYAPTQALSVALSQYAPNKQIWINGKQYTSKVIYSPYKRDRRDAWGKRRLYFECSHCGHAATEDYADERRGKVLDCPACHHASTFGPSKPWFRPPGFAHPIDLEPMTSPDAPVETAYATRAKLVMPTPGDEGGWIPIGTRVRGLPTRRNLLVSNSGPEGEGYHYCSACGRIEAVTEPQHNLFQPHPWPFPTDETEPCSGQFAASRIVLGTDFRTDIALFSLPLDAPFRARPGNNETASALRTVCEAVAKAACRLLEIESGEILAEYRPSLTSKGAAGHEVEIFIYDTLAGGAGFSPQLAGQGEKLLEAALNILADCPDHCDASCYRCLRSFRNKLDHHLLDRQLGEQLLRHALYGGYPDYPQQRIESSLGILAADLTRQLGAEFVFERNTSRTVGGQMISIPLTGTRKANGVETWITLASPVAPDMPVQSELRLAITTLGLRVLCIDDLLVRHNLPTATQQVAAALR